MIAAIALISGFLIASTLSLRRLGQQLVYRGRPALAVPMLALGAALNAGAVLLLGGLTCLAVIGRWSVVADAGGWSPELLAQALPVPPVIGAVMGLAVLTVGGWTCLRAGLLIVQFVRSDRLSRRLRRTGQPVVISDLTADAFAVAGLRGCVVIGRALFDRLDAVERQVLIAHELSHLKHRHHLFVNLVALAATVNPALKPLLAAVRVGVERWADEDAARACGARVTAGRALARTALVVNSLRRSQDPSAFGRSVSVLCATGSAVPFRTEALLATTPRRSRLLIAGFLAVVAMTGTVTGSVAVDLYKGFHSAEVCPVSGAVVNAGR